jgi:hypothetical protein
MLRHFAMFLLLLLAGPAAWSRGLQFSETMQGYVYYDKEFRRASVSLKVVIPDIDTWSRNLDVPASLTGTLFMDRLPGQPIAGTLTLLAPAPGDDGRVLAYRFSSSMVQFTGFKHVRDNAAADLLDAMTTLHGLVQQKGQPAPTFAALEYGATWSSALRFEWWSPSNVWSFANSFQPIATPWYEVLEVQGIFVRTVFGALACTTLFPVLC